MYNQLTKFIIVAICILLSEKPGISQYRPSPSLSRPLYPIWDLNLTTINIQFILSLPATSPDATRKSEQVFKAEPAMSGKQNKLIEIINSPGEKTFQLDEMDIDIQAGSINPVIDKRLPVEFSNRPESELKNFPLSKLKNDLSENIQPGLSADSTIINDPVQVLNKIEPIDDITNEKFGQTDAGKELMAMEEQSDKIINTEKTIDQVDFRQIRESIKNSKALEEGIANLNAAGNHPPSKFNQKIQAARQKLSKLKNKYSSLSSSEDIKSAVKRNSLKNVPLFKRFMLGGHIRLRALNPFSFDLDLLIGYRINKKLRTGITGQSGYGMDHNNISTGRIAMQTVGYGLFGEYFFYKGFFTHFQFQRTGTESRINGDHTHFDWKDGLLIGLGKEYPIVKKLHGICMILYDTLKKSSYPPSSPWQIKFGIIIAP